LCTEICVGNVRNSYYNINTNRDIITISTTNTNSNSNVITKAN